MEHKKLIAVKREKPLISSYLDNKNKNPYVSDLNRANFFYANFVTKVEIERATVFKIRFQQGFGSELRGHHFVVAMQTSKESNQLVTIIPLSSVKETKQYNKKSTIFIGEVSGIPNTKQSVALVNQIRTIDKIRLFGDRALATFVDMVCDEIDKYKGEFEIQEKEIYGLTKEQFEKILDAIDNYLLIGSVKRKYY